MNQFIRDMLVIFLMFIIFSLMAKFGIVYTTWEFWVISVSIVFLNVINRIIQ
jgi:hypothetical protein